MSQTICVEQLPLQCPPMSLAMSWPKDRPLFFFNSARRHNQWARWSILAEPQCFYRYNGKSQFIGTPPPELKEVKFSHDPLADLHTILASTSITGKFSIPFTGGWAGYFSYDLGRRIEPTAQHHHQPKDDRHWPLIDLAYCTSALVYDHMSEKWYGVGSPHTITDRNQGQLELADAFKIGNLVPGIDPDSYMSMVAQAKNYIANGDIYQANIAQRFSAEFSGSTRAFCAKAIVHGIPWYGAYMEFSGSKSEDGRCVLSLSPELFLQIDPITKSIVTRPIKGTRSATCNPIELMTSEKDAAELHMIVDLMRNDLGRVCEFGSVKVSNPRSIETHPTIHHGVAEIIGRLRNEITICDLLRATFPGGSITGAPKIRAMQIIDELEPVRRGPYCGAIGYISNTGHSTFNVAIRTVLISGKRHQKRVDQITGTLDYSAGAGIVADSDPLAEYRETLDKTTALRKLIPPVQRQSMVPQPA